MTRKVTLCGLCHTTGVAAAGRAGYKRQKRPLNKGNAKYDQVQRYK
jgi:hypothetical protein